MSDNPFAPTPLGKDWRPPAERGAAPHAATDDNDQVADLGALFDEPTDTEATDLGSLFSPAPENDVAADSTDASTLGALFDDVATQSTEPGTGVGIATAPPVDSGAPTQPVVRPRARKRALPQSLHGVVESGDERVAPTPAGAPAPVDTPVTAARTEQRQVDPAVATTAQSATTTEVNQRRFPLPAVPAGDAVTGHAPSPRSYLAIFARGGREVEQLWQIVDQTLGVISGDTGLQRLASTLRLVPDADVHRSQQAEFQAALRPRMAQAGITLGSVLSVEPVLDLVVDEVVGISVLGEYYRDPDVNEILVDRWDTVSIERLGRLERTPIRFRDPQHAESTARGLALKISDRAVSRSIPLVTAELPSARVTFAFGSVVKGGLSVTIRKFRALLSLEDLLVYDTLNEEMVDFLRDAVAARASILVSGGTGTGKTTIINLLSTFIPDSERVITIEDAFELKLANSHVVSLQTKEASSLDDVVSVTLADLLRNTLRMRPDRIIVGEIREGEGAMVMLTAANTGHDGTITTIHANSAEAAMNERLPDLVRQERSGMDDGVVLRSVAGAFDVVLQVIKSRNGRRYISEISNVAGVDQSGNRIILEPIFVGTETVEGTYFERRGVRADTELGRRLTQGGKTTWTN